MLKRIRLVLICAVVSICLTHIAVTQSTPAAGPGNAAGRGTMGRGGVGFGIQADPRVQNRTYVMEDTNESMPYSLFVSSQVDKDTKAPLIVLLHGLGVDNSFMMRGNVLDLAEEGGYIVVAPLGYTTGGWYGISSMAQMMGGGMRRGTTPAAPGTSPATPQTQPAPGARNAQPGARATRGFSFGSTSGGTAVTDPAKVAELSEKDVMNVLGIIRKEFNIDEQRTYLMGHSMGGAGTLYLGVKYADNWAAIGAMAPAAFTLQPDSLEQIKDMPVIIVQGDADTMVPAANARRWADKLKELNMTYEYKEIPGGDHGGVITDGMQPIFEFFAKHSKSDKTSGETSIIPWGSTIEPKAQMKESQEFAKSISDPNFPQWKAKGDQKRAYVFPGTDTKIPYRIYVPTTWDGTSKLPLVLMLHGGGGNENMYMDMNNQQMIKLAEQHGYLLVSPLGYSSTGAYGTILRLPAVFGQTESAKQMLASVTPDRTRSLELSEKDVINVLEIAANEYPVDRSAMFLTGHSMGSGGTWYLGAKYHHYWAAIAPMSGPFVDQATYPWDTIRNMPIFMTEGTGATPSLAGSRVMRDWMQENGFKLEYKEVNADHGGMVPLVLPDVFDFFNRCRAK